MEAEKYFQVAEKLSQTASSAETTLYQAKKNLIVLYLRTDLRKAKSLCEELSQMPNLINV